MNTQQTAHPNTNSLQGLIIVGIVFWLLFMGGLDVVTTYTQRLAQQPQPAQLQPFGNLPGVPTPAPAQPGQLAPLTLDGQSTAPQPAQSAPIVPIQPEQSAPNIQADVPAQPAVQQPAQALQQPALPTAIVPPLPTVAPGEPPLGRVVVASLPVELLPTATPQPAATTAPTGTYTVQGGCVVHQGKQACNTHVQAIGGTLSDHDAQQIALLIEAGIVGEPAQ